VNKLREFPGEVAEEMVRSQVQEFPVPGKMRIVLEP
jgi:hypothetical protein